MIVSLRKSIQEMAAGWTHKIVLKCTDLTESTANTAQTIPILVLPAGAAVTRAGFYLATPFQDASDAAFNTNTIIVGDSGDTDRLIPSTELNLNGTEITAFVSSNATASLPYAYPAGATINAIIGSMSAKSLSNIDIGEIHILLEVSELASIN